MSSINNTPYLPQNVYFSPDYQQYLLQITKLYTDIAQGINQREIAAYALSEQPTGQSWYDPTSSQISRQTFRKVFTLGAIAPGATLVTAHGITPLLRFTAAYGDVITAVPDFRPIPFVSATLVTDQIQIREDTVNFYITNGATAPAIISAQVVLEFLKN